LFRLVAGFDYPWQVVAIEPGPPVFSLATLAGEPSIPAANAKGQGDRP